MTAFSFLPLTVNVSSRPPKVISTLFFLLPHSSLAYLSLLYHISSFSEECVLKMLNFLLPRDMKFIPLFLCSESKSHRGHLCLSPLRGRQNPSNTKIDGID